MSAAGRNLRIGGAGARMGELVPGLKLGGGTSSEAKRARWRMLKWVVKVEMDRPCCSCGACLVEACPLRRRRWERPKKSKGLGARLRTVCGGRCPRVLSEDGQTAWPNGRAVNYCWRHQVERRKSASVQGRRDAAIGVGGGGGDEDGDEDEDEDVVSGHRET